MMARGSGAIELPAIRAQGAFGAGRGPLLGGFTPRVALVDPAPYLLYETPLAGAGQVLAGLARRDRARPRDFILWPALPVWMGGAAWGYSQVALETEPDGQGGYRIRVAFRALCRAPEPAFLGDAASLQRFPEVAMVCLAQGRGDRPRGLLLGSPECPLRRAITPLSIEGEENAHGYHVEYAGVDRRPYRSVGTCWVNPRFRFGYYAEDYNSKMLEYISKEYIRAPDFIYYPYNSRSADSYRLLIALERAHPSSLCQD